MTNIIQLESVMRKKEAAFQRLCKNMKAVYDQCLIDKNLKTKTKKGVPLLYEDLWCACAAYTLSLIKEQRPDDYQLLCDDAGGEFNLIEQALLK